MPIFGTSGAFVGDVHICHISYKFPHTVCIETNFGVHWAKLAQHRRLGPQTQSARTVFMFRVFANMACTRVTCFFGGVFFTSTPKIHALLSLSSKLRPLWPAFEQCASYKMTIRTQPHREKGSSDRDHAPKLNGTIKSMQIDRKVTRQLLLNQNKSLGCVDKPADVDRLLPIFVSTCAHRAEGRSVPLTSPCYEYSRAG